MRRPVDMECPIGVATEQPLARRTGRVRHDAAVRCWRGRPGLTWPSWLAGFASMSPYCSPLGSLPPSTSRHRFGRRCPGSTGRHCTADHRGIATPGRAPCRPCSSPCVEGLHHVANSPRSQRARRVTLFERPGRAVHTIAASPHTIAGSGRVSAKASCDRITARPANLHRAASALTSVGPGGAGQCTQDSVIQHQFRDRRKTGLHIS
jgi:hypothetical protein